MDFTLLVIIILQFAYIIYKDVLSYRERDRLQLKIMSKDLSEYKIATEEQPEEEKAEEDIYIPVEELTQEQILKAKDK